MSKNKQAREFGIQFLYHLQLPIFKEQIKPKDSTQLFNQIVEFKQTLGIILNGSDEAYITSVIKGILENYDVLEEIIQRNLKNWKISRLSKIEHTILILGTYEILFRPETPGKVVINDAIELSKKYSTKESSKFINGVLDNILKKESPLNE